MGIGLSDVNQLKRSRRRVFEGDSGPDKVLPWEKFEDRGLMTRTLSAQEAVKKAHKIVERNELFSQGPYVQLVFPENKAIKLELENQKKDLIDSKKNSFSRKILDWWSQIYHWMSWP